MNAYCPSCGGMLGRDCFNPQECAEITRQMQEHAAIESYQRYSVDAQAERLRDENKTMAYRLWLLERLLNDADEHVPPKLAARLRRILSEVPSTIEQVTGAPPS